MASEASILLLNPFDVTFVMLVVSLLYNISRYSSTFCAVDLESVISSRTHDFLEKKMACHQNNSLQARVAVCYWLVIFFFLGFYKLSTVRFILNFLLLLF